MTASSANWSAFGGRVRDEYGVVAMNAPVLLGLLVAVAALLYVLAPLLWPGAFDARGVRQDGAGAERALERLRDDLYARIVELDFDHAVGKTDEEEYRQERADLKRQALATLRLLDERAGAASGAGVEDEIEREVRLARERRATETRAVAACAACGRAVGADDRFCAGCGRPRAVPAGVAAYETAGDGQGLEDEVERDVRVLRQTRRAAGTPNVLPTPGGRRPRAPRSR